MTILDQEFLNQKSKSSQYKSPYVPDEGTNQKLETIEEEYKECMEF